MHLTLSCLSTQLMGAIHHRPPSYLCAERKGLCVYVCVFLCNNRLKINIFYVAHMSWSCCGVVYCLWVSDSKKHRCLANRVCCPLLLSLRTSVLRTSAASTAHRLGCTLKPTGVVWMAGWCRSSLWAFPTLQWHLMLNRIIKVRLIHN